MEAQTANTAQPQATPPIADPNPVAQTPAGPDQQINSAQPAENLQPTDPVTADNSTVSPTQTSGNPPIPTPENQSKPGHKKFIFLGIGIIVLILILAGGYVLFKNKKSEISMTPQPTAVPPVSVFPTVITSPTPAPITSSNVDQTLNNTDTTMQQTINQTDTDLNSINNIDKSQDSTNGL